MLLLSVSFYIFFCQTGAVSKMNSYPFGVMYAVLSVFFTVMHCYSIGLYPAGFPEISHMKRGSNSLHDEVHGVKMGIASDICDNAKNDLAVDWDGSPLNYTCFHPKNRLPIFKEMKPIEDCYVPDNYYSKHLCMYQKIEYDVPVPTYGNHRPLWPVYGEYVFVPPQRWLHSLEHGGIVMLYHPCAEPHEVTRLRKIVQGCLRRHVITPYKKLPADKPLALVAWGCKLVMNHVDEEIVKTFIKARALHGPEATLAKEGQYKLKLLKTAEIPKGSNFNDKNLCPHS